MTTTTSALDHRARADMAWIPGGTFAMGSAGFYPEERPVHRVTVDGFWMDTHPVTVAQYRKFVAATGYVTVAEQPPDPAAFPGADPELLVPGSLVFQQPAGPVDLRDFLNWWAYVPGASWEHPEGPGSGVGRRRRHPVTHVAYEDARAYARFAGKDLPTEAEWEYAARGGLDGAIYAWGDEFVPDGQLQANTWQGEFPWQNLLLDGYEGTSPVGAFPANGYGLLRHDRQRLGVDQRLLTRRGTRPRQPGPAACRGTRASPQRSRARSREPGAQIPRKVIKGGSHLCAPNYCLRYRRAARQSQTVDSAASHLGFRCVQRDVS